MTDTAANLALFLLDQTGSVTGTWTGHMPAKQQRALMGRFFGKGRIYINGSTEIVEHSRKVCFGLDSDTTHRLAWRDLGSTKVWSDHV